MFVHGITFNKKGPSTLKYSITLYLKSFNMSIETEASSHHTLSDLNMLRSFLHFCFNQLSLFKYSLFHSLHSCLKEITLHMLYKCVVK